MNGGLNLHPKTAGGGLSACVALIALWIASYWIDVPPEVAASFTAILGFIGAWLSPVIANEAPKGP